MERESKTLSIRDLQSYFVDIQFPGYQREPNIWSREEKQRLIDSILREFDIAPLYFYRQKNELLECIDGRQRINAIMSFLGKNPTDERDNGFELRIENEISSGLETDFDRLDENSFVELEKLAKDGDSDLRELAAKAVDEILDYEITTVYLSGVGSQEEFNLQFLRLNLGTLINAGEKLHAMVGAMRDVVFENDAVGKHPFFEWVRIPNRRYAKELTAAQVLLQIFSFSKTGEFARARHVELQRFLKEHEDLDDVANSLIAEATNTLNAINEGVADAADYLRNRAVTVSLILLAWRLEVAGGGLPADRFWAFATVLMGRLAWQVEKMKAFNVDQEYQHLVDFQRHLTQAAVERVALTRRHEILSKSLDQWLVNETLEGDEEYEKRTGLAPGYS